MRSKVYLRSFSDYLVENYGNSDMAVPAKPAANQVSMNYPSPDTNRILNSIITPGMSTKDIKMALKNAKFPDYMEAVRTIENKDAEAFKATPFAIYFIAQSIICAMDRRTTKTSTNAKWTNAKWLDVIADAIISEYETIKDYSHQFVIDFLDIPADMIKAKTQKVENARRAELEEMDRNWDKQRSSSKFNR